MWPFESAKAISAAINALNVYSEDGGNSFGKLDRAKLWAMLWQYTASHTPLWKVMNATNGEYCDLDDPSSELKEWLYRNSSVENFWLAEEGCADGGDPARGLDGPAWEDDPEQGYLYLHSTFVDLVMAGLVGLRSDTNGKLAINPLIPPTTLPWWAADGIKMRGKIVSVMFDMDGTRYGRGKGLKVWLDGELAASSPTMAALEVQL
jgi:hypothetical protein